MHKNHLSEEKSPYLLQHKDNPVHWFAWGDEAFELAKKENKLVFLSIGYSTCYWCHMMEKDSFEHQDAADVLNKDFISVKVDREEHPDVDQIYMDAVMGLTGRGGWPLTVFLTPDRKPFFGGTFFWKAQFISILDQLQDHWQKDPQKILDTAEQITDVLQKELAVAPAAAMADDVFKLPFAQFQKNFDGIYGGFGGAPKFPQPSQLMLLTRMARRSGDKEVLRMLDVTLTEMAKGGIYDHAGGGFHRYSTDARWFVPHFEKMLYDNAQLAFVYLEAFQLTGNQMYADVAQETLDYVLRDMTSPDGGFYSAQDAGEVNEEGDYYVWTWPVISTELKASGEISAFKSVFGIAEQGNWEHGKNVIYLPKSSSWEDRQKLKPELDTLLQARSKREAPHLDDKILTSWNGLMISAFAKGYQVLADETYLAAAQKAASFIRERLAKGSELYRRYAGGEAKYPGTLDDYAFVIEGLLHLYESDFDPEWYAWARELQAKQDELFWDAEKGGYFFTASQQTDLIVRKKESFDGAMPSGNAVAALNLLRLFGLGFETAHREKANRLLVLMEPLVQRAPLGTCRGLVAADYQLDDSKEIAVIVPDGQQISEEVRELLHESFLPNKVVAVAHSGIEGVPQLVAGKPSVEKQVTVYVCENQTCLRPATSLEDIKKAVATFSSFSF